MTDSSDSAKHRRTLPNNWWGLALVIAFPVVVLGAAAITVLLLTVRPADAKDRIEVIKAGLGVGAGTGGVVALVLAGRRQWATEDVNRVTEHDATEKRATELYAKAADQLGSDRAPVRLAGLYALERLGDDHPVLRQTVVNLLCAYLRMPFDHRGEPENADDPGRMAWRATDAFRQEREVRLTAQSILTAHLAKPDWAKSLWFEAMPAKHWQGIMLNLADATLIDFRLEGGALAHATFAGATFAGATEFTHFVFEKKAVFSKALFLEHTSFLRCNFEEAAFFSGASFQGHANFREADFARQTVFRDATFSGPASFIAAHFALDFEEKLAGIPEVSFSQATFTGKADFTDVLSSARIDFSNASFQQLTLDRAIFEKELTGLNLSDLPGSTSSIGTTVRGELLDPQRKNEAQPL